MGRVCSSEVEGPGEVGVLSNRRAAADCGDGDRSMPTEESRLQDGTGWSGKTTRGVIVRGVDIERA